MRIVPDGVYYACTLTLIGLAVSYFLTPILGTPFFLLAAFCLYFFRDPDRRPPEGKVMVAPADGKVVAVLPMEGSESRISIFLNIFDVHVNRTPIPGRVTLVQYQRGKFVNAGHEAASLENEQNTLIIQGDGTQVKCRQIAGLIARRIICYKKAGDVVGNAERIGYIKFGSRVDIVFGPEWQPVVKVGDRVRAGSTIVAQWNSGAGKQP